MATTVYSKDCAKCGTDQRIYWNQRPDNPERDESYTHDLCSKCDPAWWDARSSKPKENS